MQRMLTLLLLSQFTLCQYVNTIGGSSAGYLDGQGTAAMFNSPQGVTVDSVGNIYLVDTSNSRIRKINSTGYVSTIAGSSSGYSDGHGTNALFYFPYGLTIDTIGNIYVCDTYNTKIRKINATGYVTTLAGSGYGYLDGQGANSMFNYPKDVAVDSNGSVYVADVNNERIRKINATGYVTTLAGSTASFADGQGISSAFNSAAGLAVDLHGNIYVGDTKNNRIRKINSTGYVSTVAGSGTASFADGQGLAAMLNNPRGVSIDIFNNIFVADTSNNRIRKINATGYVTTVAGSNIGSFADGPALNVLFNNPQGVAVNSFGNIFVADAANNKIRKITFNSTLLISSAPSYIGSMAMTSNVVIDATSSFGSTSSSTTSTMSASTIYSASPASTTSSLASTFSTTSPYISSPSIISSSGISSVAISSTYYPFISNSVTSSISASTTLIYSPSTLSPNIRSPTTMSSQESQSIILTSSSLQNQSNTFYLKAEFIYSSFIGFIGVIVAMINYFKSRRRIILIRRRIIPSMTFMETYSTSQIKI